MNQFDIFNQPYANPGVGALNFGNQFGNVNPAVLQEAAAGNVLGSGGSVENSVFGSQFQNGFNFAQPSIAAPNTGGWFQNAFGKGGWGTGLLGAAQAGMNMYFGGKQLKLAEESLDTQKQQFADQFNLQRSEINRGIKDQAKARYDRNANNPTPDEYYEKHKV